ncbi:hypothetical protein [Morganella morganii]|uniref:hypothetical protein n=1 Tax=Morganella morganii TaxID=582 RepID=UPI0018B0A3A7|nr:hypothetical protein [Morganella morganii]MDI9762525.1 hypothetical protein [Morganella morganii]QPJ70100.1 hypothetical protein IR188_08105 [Morganella morganii]
MKQKYVYQSPENYAEKVNDNDGIKQLSITSMLEELLREMDRDGHDVSGPMTELVALKNYVTHTEKQRDTVRTGLEFALSALKK